MWWRRIAEVQTERQNEEERGFKWLWTWNGCRCRRTGLSISETADLGFSHTTISWVYREWSEKEKISSERQLCGRKYLVDVRGQRRMGRLVIIIIIKIIIIIICYIYIALFWVLKALYIEGEESPQPPPMCCIHLDDVTAAILCQNAQHTPAYWWRGDSDEANRCMEMIRRPWWSEANGQIWPGCRGYTLLFFEGHPGIFNDHRESGPRFNISSEGRWFLQYSVPVTTLGR